MEPLFNFEAFPILQTDRLRLRYITQTDVDDIFAIRGDYQVTKYNSGDVYTTVSQAEKLIADMQREYADQRAIRWGITLPPDDQVVGMVGYNYWDRTDHRGSIGFDLRQSQWRKGIMSEAVEAIIRFGYTKMGLNRIEADASIYNVASITLLQKMGFLQEGVQREQYYEDGTYHDLVLFALLKREWQPRKK